VSVERGHDPRDFTLVAFGGEGPLHGCSLAALLGITRVLIPPAPGVLCADGLLAADLKAEFSRTLPKAGPAEIEAARKIFAELTAQADDWLSAEKVATEDRRQSKVAMLRYRGQGGEVAVPWVDSKDGIEAAFGAAHQGLYGFTLDTPIELVTLRVEATGRMPEPPRPTLGKGGGAGMYFHVEPDGVWVGGGMYAPEMPQLHRVREHLAENITHFRSIVEAPRFKRALDGGLEGEQLQRVPRGFAKDHEAADYLRYRQFLAGKEFPASFATGPKFYPGMLDVFRTIAPLIRFLNEPLQ